MSAIRSSCCWAEWYPIVFTTRFSVGLLTTEAPLLHLPALSFETSLVWILNFHFPFGYDYDQTKYWSTGRTALQPSCILSPSTTSQVVNIVQILKNTNQMFAIKSGGHNPNRGFASIEGCPLISMRQMNEIAFDAAASIV